MLCFKDPVLFFTLCPVTFLNRMREILEDLSQGSKTTALLEGLSSTSKNRGQDVQCSFTVQFSFNISWVMADMKTKLN